MPSACLRKSWKRAPCGQYGLSCAADFFLSSLLIYLLFGQSSEAHHVVQDLIECWRGAEKKEVSLTKFKCRRLSRSDEIHGRLQPSLQRALQLPWTCSATTLV